MYAFVFPTHVFVQCLFATQNDTSHSIAHFCVVSATMCRASLERVSHNM